MANWHNVSKREPCPICHKPDWCTVSNDGMMCVCRRVESQHPAKSGCGWIHVLVERPFRERARLAPRQPRRRLFNAEAAMRGYRAEILADALRSGDAFGGLRLLAEELWLPPDALDRLWPGMSAFHGAWAFPMLDGCGRTVGIRLRQRGAARKWSVAGSADGLFFDRALTPAETVSHGIRGREIVVVEGATDCAAGYALGLPCVGRSSCGTGAKQLLDLCARLRVGRVTVVADNDAYKFRPADCLPWRPGIEGAARLAHSLGRLYRIVTPPRKDLREWYYAGLTAQTFWMVADLQPWRIGEVKWQGG